MIAIDLNSDLGEQADSILDEQIMPFISSCNIACGGHAGDKASVKRTIALAKKHEVAIGAHPSYPDRENFGRQIMEIEAEELMEHLDQQIRLVKELAEDAGQELHHVKPHGALYNLAAVDAEIAQLVVSVIQEIDPALKLYGLSHSEMEKEATYADAPFVGESFADRKYELDRTLRNRKYPDAVIVDEKKVLAQVENLVFQHVAYCNGNELEIYSQTICLHSDTEGAVNLAKAIYTHLENKGATITAV